MMVAEHTLPDGLLVSWVGDDFTGAAAVMEVLTFAGLPSVLFLDVPTDGQLSRFDGMRGVGIATTARAQSPRNMSQSLPPVFDWLAGRNAPIAHYKICSTLDSSPAIGSIGHAIELGTAKIKSDWVPCLVAAPAIRRYQAFGHVFAAAPDAVHRLDRHPVMARHPVTPMDEADVRLHLAQQTSQRIGLVDAEALDGDTQTRLDSETGAGATVIALDTVVPDHLTRCGQLIWENRQKAPFVVGSQGVEYALVSYWQERGLLPVAPDAPSAGPVDRMIVVSGSASAVTDAQIGWAAANGFDVIGLDAAAISTGDEDAENRAVEEACRALSEGRDPLIATARGPDDPAIADQRRCAANAGISSEEANARIGAALGRVLTKVIETTGLRRAAVSGGDTSGHAMGQLGVFALTAVAPTIPGAALLCGHSERAGLDGLQIALKGGQMGSPDYFGWIKNGAGARPGISKGPN